MGVSGAASTWEGQSPNRSHPSGKEAMRTLLANPKSPYRLPGSAIDQLVAASQITNWRGDQRIIEPTTYGDFVHFVVAGSVRIEVDVDRRRAMIATIVPPGRFIGSLLPAPSSTCRFAAVTHAASLIAILSRGTVGGVVENLPLDCTFRLATHSANQLRRLLADRCRLAWASTRTRLIHELHELARDFGRPVPGGTLIDLALTHAHLACLIVASRSNVTRALGRLRRAGVLEVVSHRIMLCRSTGGTCG